MAVRFSLLRALPALLLAAASPLLVGSAGMQSNLDARLLAAHNRERSAAGLSPLAWDDQLAGEATDWGRHLARIGTLEHSPDEEDDADAEGENLWLGSSGDFSAEAMVGDWISEKKDYRPGIFPDNSRTGDFEDVGHYTQLMWRTTGRVGCGVVNNGRHDILVCRYKQAGNVVGERPF